MKDRLISVAEYAEMEGITVQAARKRINSGKVKAIKVEDPKQPSGKWMIAVETVETVETTEATRGNQAPKSAADAVETVETAVETAVETNEIVKSQGSFGGEVVKSQGNPVLRLDTIDRLDVPMKYEALVNARIAVINAANDSGDVAAFHKSWINGLILEPQLKICQGKAKRPPALRTLYQWMKDYKNGGAAALVPAYSRKKNVRSVPEEIQKMLLKILLKPNKTKIGTAIAIVKDHCRVHKIEIPCSDKTLERWCKDWEKNHKAQWILARDGVKAYRERINRTILRDWSLIEVGDVWFSDGHMPELMIIDPEDGKAKRFQLIAWFDGASRMPVGASLNITENTEVIGLSLRNALLYAGYKPKAVYIDNGKAYKSKYFAGSKKSAEDIDIELQGLYARLGIEVIYAQPYNAKAKTIERWWLTLQEQVERQLPAWTGRNAIDKPANLKRDEKWTKQNHPYEAITIQQFKAIFEYWAININGALPHPEQKDKTRLQVWQEGSQKIELARMIDPAELNWLMMPLADKKVGNQGIRHNNCIYYDEALVRYVGRNVTIRWDFWNINSILVYDGDDKLICQAELRELQDPTVRLREEGSISHRKLRRDLSRIRAQEKQDKEATQQTLKRVSDATSGLSIPINQAKAGLIIEEKRMIQDKAKSKTFEERIQERELSAPTEEAENKDDKNKHKNQKLRSLGF